MLARTEGKTAQELNITQIERDTLVKLMKMLRSGKIDYCKYDWALDLKPPGLHIDMGVWHHAYACGTVGCIGGLCYVLSKGKAFSNYGMKRPDFFSNLRGLSELFYPVHMSTIRDPIVIADAIESFLNTGSTTWA